MITERTLRQWRKDALKTLRKSEDGAERFRSPDPIIGDLAERILRLTQELLDQYLLRK